MILAAVICRTVAGAWPVMARATARSRRPTRSAGRARVRVATLRASQGSQARSVTWAQVRGRGVGDQGAGGGGVGLAGHGQLGDRVLAHRWGALAAGLGQRVASAAGL